MTAHSFKALTKNLQKLPKFFASLLVGLAILLTNYVSPTTAQLSAQQLADDIDEFFSAGARGYLVWQYGGDLNGRQIAVDQYSFFRDAHPEICEVMQQKANEWPDRFIGVNINNIGANEFQDGTALEHLSYLRDNCGVSVVRIFAKIEGVSGVMSALETANQVGGIQLIVAVGDYSNGGGGMPRGAGQSWYESGWRQPYAGVSYEELAIGLRDAINASPARGALYGFELANEPHCSGNRSAEGIQAYRNWAEEAGAILQGASSNVGYGQMASQNTTRCDSPGVNTAADPSMSDFEFSNRANTITMTSAHYYNEAEKLNALLALSISLDLGKPFYIGEAPPGGDRFGDDVGPDRPGHPGGDGYDTSMYPRYRDLVGGYYGDEDYYLYPICIDEDFCVDPAFESLSPGIKYNLIQQGYQVHCATPEIDITLEKHNEWQRFLELLLAGRLSPEESANFYGVESSYIIDLTGMQVPLYRDVSDTRWLMASIEEYFGFKDIYVGESAQALHYSSALENLLTTSQKCNLAMSLLNATMEMCYRLEVDWDGCPLNKEIPRPPDSNEPAFSTLGLFGEIGGQGLTCRDIVNNPEYEVYRNAISRVPLYLDRAYRVAFLVFVFEQVPDDPGSLFSFFAPDNPGATPLHEVRAVAFKVPDIGVDRHTEHLRYDDPIQLTRDGLMTWEARERFVAIKNEEKNNRLSQSGGLALRPQNLHDPVQCEGRFECSEDPVTRALVDMINGTAPGCREYSIEPASRISDHARVSDHPSRIQQEDLGRMPAQLPSDLFLDRNDTNVMRARFEFLSNLYVRNLDQSGSTTANIYLIYPGDIDIREANRIIPGAFFTTKQLEHLREREDKKERWPFWREVLNFLGGSVGREFVDPDECEYTTNPETGETERICQKKHFGLSIEMGQPPLTIPNAGLGYWMRTIQESLSSTMSSAYWYIISCETTEQFLLGRCPGGEFGRSTGGGPRGAPGPGPGAPGAGCNEFNCFGAGVRPGDFQASVNCAAMTLGSYLRNNLDFARMIDRYGPYCDNETLGMPWAYNFVTFYDQYLPPGTPGGRTCSQIPPNRIRDPEDRDMACLAQSHPSRQPGDERFDYYRGDLMDCPVPDDQLRWTDDNSFGMSPRELAEYMQNDLNVTYGSWRLADTPTEKVVEVLERALSQNVNPWLMISTWATESWFGQFPWCVVSE